MVFHGQRFVLTVEWPGLEGGQGLTLGKESVKALSGFLRLTNILVIGDKPGHKKVLNTHERSLPTVKLDQLTSIIIINNKTSQDLSLAP
jgi:hypothetical protein